MYILLPFACHFLLISLIISGFVSSGNLKKRVDVLMENGEICETDIPFFSLNEGERGVTVIEDHTMVMCGGMKTNGDGMTFKLYLYVKLAVSLDLG